jgi:hypothetical protein
MLRRSFRPAGGFFIPFVAVPFVAGGLLLLTGCNDSTPAGKQSPVTQGKSGGADHDHEHHHHHHAEKGPHGGALVAIGHDDAHLEIVLNAETGTVTAYVLDGAAEKPVAIKQKNLQLALTLEHGHHHDEKKGEEDKKKEDEVPDATELLMLAAVSPGEDGTASEFSGQLDALKGADEFDAALTTITIGDKEFPGVTFNYPKGNEHDHHH